MQTFQGLHFWKCVWHSMPAWLKSRCVDGACEIRAAGRKSRCGWVAQLVEQRTENPCVGGSIPPPATTSQNSPGPPSFPLFAISVVE